MEFINIQQKTVSFILFNNYICKNIEDLLNRFKLLLKDVTFLNISSILEKSTLKKDTILFLSISSFINILPVRNYNKKTRTRNMKNLSKDAIRRFKWYDEKGRYTLKASKNKAKEKKIQISTKNDHNQYSSNNLNSTHYN